AWSLVIFFFFQAEDGIRGFHVTGVQTCALPIYQLARGIERTRDAHFAVTRQCHFCGPGHRLLLRAHRGCAPRRLRLGVLGWSSRSEERRVGKEWRSRWAREQCRRE